METTAILIVAGMMVVLMAVGVPLAFVFMAAAFVGLVIIGGTTFATTFVKLTTFWSTYGYTLALVPLFILMGNLLGGTDVIPTLFRILERIFVRVRGGLAHIVVVMSAVFGACSGSSIAACGVFTPITLPSMTKLGYKRSFSAGCIASAATVAVMIPPSITMVVYGIITETAIGPLLIAGIFPGLINTALYSLTIIILVTLKPEIAPSRGSKEILALEPLRWSQSIISVTTIGVIVLAVIGGIYSGLFTPSQAGAAGAFVAFLVYLARRRKQAEETGLLAILKEVGTMTAVIFFILMGAMLLARFMELSGFIGTFVSFMEGLPIPPLGVVFIILLIYLLMGQIFDPMSMMVLTLPIFFPLVTGLGFHPLWFGVIVVQLVEIAALTPPVGFNVFTVSTATKGAIPPEEIFRGVLPFILACLVMLVIIIFLPSVALWLPSQMFP